jgi:hypothetical protein
MSDDDYNRQHAVPQIDVVDEDPDGKRRSLNKQRRNSERRNSRRLSEAEVSKVIEGLYNHGSEANLVEKAAPEPEHFTGLSALK